MARIVKDYDERYAEFLDVAEGLFFTKGYEATSVQEIIRTVGVAKGTFYHYFDSKVDILEAIAKRMVADIGTLAEMLIADDSLSAIEKLEQLFKQTNNEKMAQRDGMMEVARILYHDENILLRRKLFDEAAKIMIPTFTKIIQQGIAEDTFKVDYPEETAELLYIMIAHFDQLIATSVLANDPTQLEKLQRQLAFYSQSQSRILGMADDALSLFDESDLMIWLNSENSQNLK